MVTYLHNKNPYLPLHHYLVEDLLLRQDIPALCNEVVEGGTSGKDHQLR